MQVFLSKSSNGTRAILIFSAALLGLGLISPSMSFAQAGPVVTSSIGVDVCSQQVKQKAARPIARAKTVTTEFTKFVKVGTPCPRRFKKVATFATTQSVEQITQNYIDFLISSAGGLTGSRGETGATGPRGPQGERGVDGATGPIGPQGPQGLTGAVGATGPQGAPGSPGAAGAQGLAGARGDIGPTGPTGPQGPAGANGANGLSAYQVWLAAGNIGTEVEYLLSLRGQAGAAGPQGPAGATGPQGPRGADGAPGSPGATGAQGPAGPRGDTGAQGPAGAVGATGPAGPQGSAAAIDCPANQFVAQISTAGTPICRAVNLAASCTFPSGSVVSSGYRCRTACFSGTSCGGISLGLGNCGQLSHLSTTVFNCSNGALQPLCSDGNADRGLPNCPT